MRLPLYLVALAACGSDLQRHTHAFVASASCAQGPFEVVLHADGKTGADGVEVVACTPRRLAGHVELDVGELALHRGWRALGDVGRRWRRGWRRSWRYAGRRACARRTAVHRRRVAVRRRGV